MAEEVWETKLREVVESDGFEFVELKKDFRKRLLIIRLFIDKEGGINISECAKVSRNLNDYIFTHDLIGGDYRIEVSSPGIDRKLTSARDFERHLSRKIRVLYNGEKGPETYEGVLEKVEGEDLLLKANSSEKVLNTKDVISGKVVLPW